MSDFRGRTPEEVAEAKKDKLVSDYCSCKAKIAEIKQHEQTIEHLKTVYNEKIVKYRIDSVNRVLAYIREKDITDHATLETLLCHCQNKLYGNVDGIELELSEQEGE